MTAQQELFGYFKTALPQAYDGALPAPDAPYPFYYLAETYEDIGASKTGTYGTVTLIAHVWHNDWNQRGTVSAMIDNLRSIADSVSSTQTYKWSHIRNESEFQLLADNTTRPPLMHGWLSLRFMYSKKG